MGASVSIMHGDPAFARMLAPPDGARPRPGASEARMR